MIVIVNVMRAKTTVAQEITRIRRDEKSVDKKKRSTKPKTNITITIDSFSNRSYILQVA